MQTVAPYETTTLNPADLMKLTNGEVRGLADIDCWAVRNEGFRRHEIAAKKIIRLEKALHKARLEAAEAELIVKASLAQIEALQAQVA